MTSSPKTTLCRGAGSFGPVAKGASNSTRRAPCLSSCGKKNTQNKIWHHGALEPGPGSSLQTLRKDRHRYHIEPAAAGPPGGADRRPFPLPLLAVVDSRLPLPAFPFPPFPSHSLPFHAFLFCCLYVWPIIPESSGSFSNALPLLRALPTRVVPRSRARDSLSTGPHGQGMAVALGQPSVLPLHQ